MPENTYLLLGSNMGDRERHLSRAVAALETLEGFEITATSPIFVSDADGMPDDAPSFLNQVVKGDYIFTAHELLRSIELIEKKLGRTDKGKVLPRTIDIDILLFGEEVVATDTLIIPHPRLLLRGFAMIPLVTIDPDLIHPVTHEPIADSIDATMRQNVLLFKDHVSRNV
jgi:2-amino-4-hydroxy-6-hydroxymethyldihydropteridine diphosphokinase